ncbi:MAG TPA: alpha/beta hydrolase [Alphaproteobacteria bacterium]|nr:alpha/beta hydrolase [Alphaproteobacteria bacterium]
MARPEEFGFMSGYAHANGVRLHYARTGTAADGRLPLMLLHGWPEFWLTWRKLMPLLSQEFDLIAPDLRGFGRSDKPSFGPSRQQTPDVMAADILGLADALGLKRFGLVGHDVGAMVMQSIARAAPVRVAGLFFFNCPYPGIGQRWYAPDHIEQVWYQNFHQLPWAAQLIGSSRDACCLYLRHFLTRWSASPNAFREDIQRWVDNFMQPGNLQGGFNWYLSVHETRMAIARGELPLPPPIPLPTHVLWGRYDPVLKVEWTDRIPEFFPNAKVEVCENAGHFVHYEAPEEAAAAIRSAFRPRGPGKSTDENRPSAQQV